MASRSNSGSGGGGIFVLVLLVALGFFFGPFDQDDTDADQQVTAGAQYPSDPESVQDGQPTQEPAESSDKGFDAASARARLDSLPVKGRAPRTGFSRDQFGPTWPTNERGCDARNETLARDLDNVVFRPGSGDCVVLTGTLNCPYSGKTIDFVRGRDTSNAVHIDHRVSLSDAWQTGAQQWDADKRQRFANDPINLVAVDGPTNMSKSDSNAASWLPPNKAYRCRFVAAQVDVKYAYSLWVTQPERDAIANVLERC